MNNLFFARSQIGMSLAFYIIFAAMLGCGRSTIVTSLPLPNFQGVKKSGDAIESEPCRKRLTNRIRTCIRILNPIN